mmetsp:Transcript_28377/g.39200  ORF Transcript_28377/g.39200 Transcript_28377/m.39200 type:complete len:198 (-) Transcript_28377:178-771(-)
MLLSKARMNIASDVCKMSQPSFVISSISAGHFLGKIKGVSKNSTAPQRCLQTLSPPSGCLAKSSFTQSPMRDVVHRGAVKSIPSRRAFSSVTASSNFKLILYSKDGCCLCDGLKEKFDALFEAAKFSHNSVSGAVLEVRDITSSEELFQKYKFEIPVLARAELDDSDEITIPRPSPRANASQLDKHLHKFYEKIAGN